MVVVQLFASIVHACCNQLHESSIGKTENIVLCGCCMLHHVRTRPFQCCFQASDCTAPCVQCAFTSVGNPERMHIPTLHCPSMLCMYAFMHVHTYVRTLMYTHTYIHTSASFTFCSRSSSQRMMFLVRDSLGTFPQHSHTSSNARKRI